ncbi:hypothetical protein [Leptothoe kymatousa]|uniref:Uncharacterized protein n=1 Tax=Leptothoe kymatousa TAU-MAC 1615 TaxID=2364775 RepID=A0ABS5Y4Y7_9CYAN|nr:hypothetical protein [Leptothoe kymatousa]MBT9312040.1 hypothetical protein [Leptothoe kymatousa TAU-MAC 1615]
MEPITREQLKRQIDTLDTAYLGLVYRVLRQFPHTKPHQEAAQPSENGNKSTFSQRWRGKLGTTQFSSETLAADPRLAYLAERYKL